MHGMAITGILWQFMSISGNQWQSVAISGNQWQSMAIDGNQWQSKFGITCIGRTRRGEQRMPAHAASAHLGAEGALRVPVGRGRVVVSTCMPPLSALRARCAYRRPRGVQSPGERGVGAVMSTCMQGGGPA